MADKKILVVGGAGYIGGIVTDMLQSLNKQGKNTSEVDVFDILWFEQYYLKPSIHKFTLGDVRSDKFWAKINEYDTVIWLAAVVGDAACAVRPEVTTDLNVNMIKRLSKDYKGRIIFASTCSVYGLVEGILTEESRTNPLSLYAETKLEAEYLLRQYAKDRTMIFRLGTIHGLGDCFSRPRFDLVANVMARDAVLKKKLTVFGGDQYRPLLHVVDAGATFAMSAFGFKPGTYNLAESNYSMLELAAHIIDMYPDTKMEITEQKTEDNRSYRVSADKARNELGFRTDYNVRNGIHEMGELSRILPDPYLRLFNNHLHMKDILSDA